MKKLLFSILLFISVASRASFILIPMDETQSNHLKAYGIAYWVLTKNVPIDWLLNYRGGSFAFPYSKDFEKECLVRNVKYENIPDASMSKILQDIADPEVNMDAVRLEKAPKVAVYSPKANNPWDDAVTLVLTYAEIPYTVIYDEEILTGCICITKILPGSMVNFLPPIKMQTGTGNKWQIMNRARRL